MGSVRKVAVTAGLGAAIAAGAAAPALAADHTAAPQTPTVPKVAQENAGTIGPFSVSQVTDTLGTGQVTDAVAGTAGKALPAGLPPVTGTPAFAALPATPGQVVETASSTLPAVPDLGVPGLPDATNAVTAGLPAATLPGLPGVAA
ncbi:hypothetical protein LO772_13245 [Yinghuangia sp. ASG 101]|uniref:hypothetical protein n=1 Tax=Yinghuangia sp. ASG 101 TaxID=2896848 RepID=UPI001E39EF45|nr:hypothetical protein [Yinghuangia sp. ASG 101]UGQ14462.1 hypothetical protein LO772_13245 [Yinghuangia sp. ASG 101]